MISDGAGGNKKDDFDYRAPLYPEEIKIYVDDAGKVHSFVWGYPLQIEEKLTENAALLTFDDIEQRIRDMLTFINSYDSHPTTVTSVKLKMTIVDVKDHPEEAMYVPAFFIYYSKIYEDSQIDLILTLNAIDGGRVLQAPIDLGPEIQAEMEKDK